MSKLVDLKGRTFGRLVVQQRDSTVTTHVAWVCLCSCGDTVTVRAAMLSSNRTKSCGCLRVDHGRKHGAAINLKHGEGRNGHETPEYRAWSNMLSRCNNPNHAVYADYGGRGITVCARWASYENFLADMGRAPIGHSIDRINNAANYEPSNCRWATPAIQSANARNNHRGRPVRSITVNGHTRSLTEWLAITGIARRTFYARVTAGEIPEEVIASGLLGSSAGVEVRREQRKRPGRQAGKASFNRQLTLCGKSRRLFEWLAICKLSRANFRKQAESGMCPEDIILSALVPD